MPSATGFVSALTRLKLVHPAGLAPPSVSTVCTGIVSPKTQGLRHDTGDRVINYRVAMPAPDATSARKSTRFGIFEADFVSGELRKDGIRIRLQEQPFQVLVMLLARPGEMVTREQLRARLWPSDTFVDFDHSLNTAVNKLREALGD